MGHTTENPAQARRLPSFAILLLPLAKQVLVVAEEKANPIYSISSILSLDLKKLFCNYYWPKEVVGDAALLAFIGAQEAVRGTRRGSAAGRVAGLAVPRALHSQWCFA